MMYCFKSVLSWLIVIMLVISLYSCGRKPEMTIWWNDSIEEYLLFDEIIEAPSGELRIKQTGRYLNRSDWQKRQLKRSELKDLVHHEK